MLRRSSNALFFSFANKMKDKIASDEAAEAESFEQRRHEALANRERDAITNAINDGSDDPRVARASRPPRSSLFIPCSNLKALNKIPSLNADVFILDLEDSVPLNAKAQARDNLIDFVSKGYEDGSLVDKRLIVRVNSPTYSSDTMRFGVDDMNAAAMLGERIEGVGIPKTSARDADLIRDTVHPLHTVWAFLETPQSIIDANAILSSKFYSVAAMGLNDLSMELQLPLDYHMSTGSNKGKKDAPPTASSDPLFSRRLPLLFHMMAVINAARANNAHPLDGVFNDPTDTLGFVNEANECKRLGFSGKTLIHPKQIDAIHKVYAPTADEVEWAERVVKALHGSGGGVAVVDGKMVEDLHGRMARRILVYTEEDAAAAAASAVSTPQ